MTISTYAQLQSTIAWYANRDDLFTAITFSPATIDTAVQIAISQAEQRADFDINAKGGVKYAQTVNNALTTTGGTETVTLPTDFVSQEAFMLTTDPYQVMRFLSPIDLFSTYTSATVQGKPEAFSIIGTNTGYFRPIPDGVYSTRLIYKAKLSPLSNTNTSNWLLANGLQVYIAASMLELSIMLENDEKTAVWLNNYQDAIDRFMGQDMQTRWATVSPVPRPQGIVA